MQQVHVRYNFAGALLFPSEPQQNVDLQGIVQLSGPVSGFFKFDASTAATSPGTFDLPTAIFEGDFGGLKVKAKGGQAVVSGANDSTLSLAFPLPGSEFPVPITTAKASFNFITYIDFFFSQHFLPVIEVNTGDRSTSVQFTDTHGKHGDLSTDTNVHFTAFHLKIT